MGSNSSSIHPEIMIREEIKKSSEKAFDYNPSFYDAYKVGENGKNPYDEYSIKLKAGLIK
jgi:hypothetical protein